MVTAFTTNGPLIEHMHVYKGIIDTATIKTVSQLQQLKVLELDYLHNLTDEHMIMLATGLGSKLEKLQLKNFTTANLITNGLKMMLPFATKLSLLTLKSTKITINADDYMEMLRVLRKRPEKTKLTLELIDNGGQVKVDETILLENRDLFYIDEKFSLNGDDLSFD